jgi:hypothetical protein
LPVPFSPRSSLGEHGEELAHVRRATLEVDVGQRALELAAQLDDAALRRAAGAHPLDDGADLVGAERLLQHVARAELDGLDRVLDGAVGGHDDDVDERARRQERWNQGQAVAVPEPQIEKGEIERLARQRHLGRLAARGLDHARGHVLETDAQRGADVLLVVDHEHVERGLAARGRNHLHLSRRRHGGGPRVAILHPTCHGRRDPQWAARRPAALQCSIFGAAEDCILHGACKFAHRR